jgi:hypothetical protein
VGGKFQIFIGVILALPAIDPMDCNFEDELVGAYALAAELAGTSTVGLNIAGAAIRAAVLLAFDSCVVGSSYEFRGDVVETPDFLIMIV